MTDFTEALITGNWTHEFIPTNGTRLHVALAGPQDPDATLVVLLHTFPLFWWQWRNQITFLSELGYRVAAVDLRGYAASDKPPLGYDIPTGSRDIAGVIRSLGHQDAIIIGHGLGGGPLAWSMPTLQPAVCAGIGIVSCPHPARIHARLRNSLTRLGKNFLVQVLASNAGRKTWRKTGRLHQLLASWQNRELSAEVFNRYTSVLKIPFANKKSVNSLYWFAGAMPFSSGRRFLSVVRTPITTPTLLVKAEDDRFFHPDLIDADARALCTRLNVVSLAGGHNLPEDSPAELNETLRTWLSSLK